MKDALSVQNTNLYATANFCRDIQQFILSTQTEYSELLMHTLHSAVSTYHLLWVPTESFQPLPLLSGGCALISRRVISFLWTSRKWEQNMSVGWTTRPR